MLHSSKQASTRERPLGGRPLPTQPRNRVVQPPLLTAREIEVLQAIADGHPNHEIAGLLTISEPTVKTHVVRLFARLRARTRAHAVTIGFRNHLIH